MVTMPWASLTSPSLALGNLSAVIASLDHVAAVDTRYVNFDWAEHLYDLTGGRVGPLQYSSIAESYVGGIGEWIFAGALYDTPLWRFDEVRRHLRPTSEQRWLDDGILVEMHRAAGPFIGAEADVVAAGEYDVVGFSTTFLQNVATLALAKEVKRRSPATMVVLGGANCDGDQGAALHRNFGFIDAVVRGEGEVSFPLFLASLAGQAEPAEIGGLCWRRDGGRSEVNRLPARPVSMAVVPAPDHGGYFERLEASSLRRFIDPVLALEASRGCWWGERHHCTFCGLNGSLMEFRSKPATRFLDELRDAVSRHRVLDVELTDNILDMRYLKTLLPGLAAADWDVRIFAEVKANLTRAHVRALREAGITRIQPGIENLASSVLALMDKGVTGTQNVRLLRDCRSEGVSVSWNLLYGFPGESEEAYRDVIRQIPRLVHLQPPAATYRIGLERFSPLFTDPSLGLENRGPAAVYRAIYDLPEQELGDLVYLFDSGPAGIRQDVIDRLVEATDGWRAGHGRSSLVHRWSGAGLLIEDGRPTAGDRTMVLAPGGEAEAYLALMRPRTRTGVRQTLTSRWGIEWDEDAAEAWLRRMDDLGLIYADEGRYVSLSCDFGAGGDLGGRRDQDA
jgi:ribosomal peptide maturation radical SAM protein 1